jgi:hypothetical protein
MPTYSTIFRYIELVGYLLRHVVDIFCCFQYLSGHYRRCYPQLSKHIDEEHHPSGKLGDASGSNNNSRGYLRAESDDGEVHFTAKCYREI